MRRSWRVLCGLGLAVAAAAAGVAPAALTAQEPTFPARATGVSSVTLRQLFVDYWRWHLADEPEDATRVGVHSFDDRWHDWSRAARAAARERRQEFLRNFQYAGLGNLTNRERLSLALIEQRLSSELAAENLRLLSRLSLDGAHQQVFAVVDAMPKESVADYDRLLARLRALPLYVEQHIELWSEQLASGVTQPASVVDRVAAGLDAQRRVSAEHSPLLAAFGRFPAAIPDAERARLTRAAREAYVEQFVPAWTRLEQFLRGRYRPRARGNLGIGQSPAHQEQYAAVLAYYGAPAGSVDAWHEEAMAEIARLEQRRDLGRAAQGDALSPASSPATRAVESDSAVPEFRLHLRLPAFDDGWTVFAALRLATGARENGSEQWEQAVTAARDAASEAALDSGIHGRGWSREQALTFATAHLGAREADAVVDRVAAVPGRALAVFAGARKFAALQRAAEARLRERFDEREFDRIMLANGALPLDFAELRLEEFLRTRPAGSP